MVCANVNVPIYFCVVVAGDDYFSCFAEHDDAFFCGCGRVFAVGNLMLCFILFTFLCELAELQYLSGGEVHQRIFCSGFHLVVVYLARDCLRLFFVVG